ncbi:hypothetical protein L596_020839 [Steinernema carpocapsae]|uniref:Uncharacterized protein n=1 Tax=Steinernema carpocapsae TaxID=34508 RepID=A0A4U5MUS7_STECR|nr:hypothetical protein L596_020765 [Steinernema carpocapsae]TKR73540.1 hypothetical protein L596_020839 [Steinernema carpocapsae]
MCLLSQAGRTGNEQYLLNTGEEFIHLVPFCMGTMCTVKSIIQLPEGYDNSNDVAGLIKYGTNDDIRRYSWQFRNGDYYDIYDSAFLPIDVISCNGCPINPENYCMEPKE